MSSTRCVETERLERRRSSSIKEATTTTTTTRATPRREVDVREERDVEKALETIMAEGKRRRRFTTKRRGRSVLFRNDGVPVGEVEREQRTGTDGRYRDGERDSRGEEDLFSQREEKQRREEK